MPRITVGCFAAAALLTLSLFASAGDLKVPSQYKTIQAAIDAAKPYDRVLVAPGTYRERLTFRGIPLLVQSEQGARLTTVDAGGNGSVVTFDPRDDRFVMLKGFTLTGGRVDAADARGGGINCGSASPVIVENIIAGNTTMGQFASLGAGLYATGAPIVANNEIRDNISAATARNTHHSGGGLYATGGWFLANRIVGNTMVSARNIRDKVDWSRGGGAALYGPVVFLQNRVIGNHTCLFGDDAQGGGLALQGSPIVAVNLIRNNAARGVRGRGGGILCEKGSRPIIFGNVIVENFAEAEWAYFAEGGGVHMDSGSSPVFTYNTVRANRTSGFDGRGNGIMAFNASPLIVGCIFWGNTFWKDGADTKIDSLNGVSGNSVFYSLIGDGQFKGSNGNFTADPVFADAYHLGVASPCIDRGEPVNPIILPGLEFDGKSRVLDGRGSGTARIDVGASEFGVMRRANRDAVYPGASVPLVLDATGLPSLPYLCAASFGNAGIPLPPPDPRVIPLTFDALFLSSVGQRNAPFQDFYGVLGAKGDARLRLDIPPVPALAGVTFHVAGLVLGGTTVRLVTNDVVINVGT